MSVVDNIPIDIMERMLNENMIANAVPIASSVEMGNLMVIWRGYVEPELQVNCNLCYNRILNNFRQLQDNMVERVRLNNML